jgi:hypothetical protein
MKQQRLLALLLCVLLAAPGCTAARASHTRLGAPGLQKPARADAALMAEYIRQIPVGSKIRVSLSNGSVMRATLMKRDADPIVVQRRTRIPEAPVEIAVRDIVAVELETGNGSVGRTIGVVAGAAAAATFAVVLMLVALLSD